MVVTQYNKKIKEFIKQKENNNAICQLPRPSNHIDTEEVLLD
jgi:hypothetical protein